MSEELPLNEVNEDAASRAWIRFGERRGRLRRPQMPAEGRRQELLKSLERRRMLRYLAEGRWDPLASSRTEGLEQVLVWLAQNTDSQKPHQLEPVSAPIAGHRHWISHSTAEYGSHGIKSRIRISINANTTPTSSMVFASEPIDFETPAASTRFKITSFADLPPVSGYAESIP